MTKRMSIFLDAVRFLAAIAVLIGHLSQPRFSRVGPDLTRYAICAVSAFFVLSGFVISFVVETKEKTATVYAISRLSRLYSVLIPATIVSMIVYFIVMHREPALVSQLAPPGSPLLIRPYGAAQIAYTSLQSWTFLSSFCPRLLLTLPALDVPIWSLAYEFAYYVVFAVWVFGRGYWRVAGVVIGCLLMGRTAVELFPIWLLGVLLQTVTLRVGELKKGRAWLGCACMLGLMATLTSWRSYCAWCNAPHTPRLYYLLHANGYVAVPYLFYISAVAMLWLLLAVASLQQWLGPVLDTLERPVRWLAGNTFSIYLFHLPVFAFLHALIRYNLSSRLSVTLIFVADIAICLLLAQVSEHRKVWWRGLIAGIFARLELSLRSIRSTAPPSRATP